MPCPPPFALCTRHLLAMSLLSCATLPAAHAESASGSLQLEGVQITEQALSEQQAAEEQLERVPGGSNLVDMQRVEQGLSLIHI